MLGVSYRELALSITSFRPHQAVALAAVSHQRPRLTCTMGSSGRSSGEQERKLEGGVPEKQPSPSPVSAQAPPSDGGIHPAVYIAYVQEGLPLNGHDANASAAYGSCSVRV